LSPSHRLVEVSPEEQQWARNEFPGSRPQRVLHNFLVLRIEESRNRLETAAPSEVPAIQAALREARTLLGEIHAHDPESVTKLYGP